MEVEAPRRAASARLVVDAEVGADAELREAMDPANQSLADALRLSYRVLQFVILSLLALFLVSGFQRVDESQSGVMLRFGRIVEVDNQRALAPGLRRNLLPYPAGEFVIFDVGNRSVDISTTFFPVLGSNQSLDQAIERASPRGTLRAGKIGYVLTDDGDIAHLKVAATYDIVDPVKLVERLNVDDADRTVKLALDRARGRDAQWRVTKRRIPARGQRNVQDQYLEFLEYRGVDPEPLAWDIRLSEEERAAQTACFTELDRPACAVVLGTSKLEKNWNAEGYARVLEQIESVHGLRPVIIGGPSPVERRIADEVIASTGASVVDALGDDVRKLVWILEGSALLISPDTGPLHISRALETPVVGLYGYTNPKRLGPYRAFEDLIVDGYAEYPGEQYPVTSTYREGMQRITVDAVLEKVSLAMERYVRV